MRPQLDAGGIRGLIVRRALAAASWLPWALSAQELSTAAGHYHLDVWRAQDGVRLTFVSNLVQTRDGYLWLSSQSGLTRFDGVRFTVFDGSNTPQLRGHPNLETYPVLEDQRGVLWIGTDAGLFAYQAGQVRPAALDSTFKTDQVNAGAVDSTGTVWTVTRSGRVLRITPDGVIRPIPGTTVSYSGSGSGITVDALGDVWIAAGEHAVYRIHHDSLSPVAFPSDLTIGSINQVYAAADSSLWFGTATSIVQRRHGIYRRIPLPPKHAIGTVSCFAVAPDGALWIGTVGAGLYRYDGSRFTAFSSRDGLSDDRIVAILVDRSHNIWVATRDGLNRLRPVPFRVVTAHNGLPADLPGALVQDRSGAVWVAPPTGGLFRGRVASDHVDFTPIEAVSHADRVNALAYSSTGSILTGWLGGSVRRVNENRQRGQTVIDGLAPVTDVLEDANGTLWIGTWHGLYRIRGGRVRVLTVLDGLVDNAVQRIFRDSRGTLWVATETGVARAEDNADRFTSLPTTVAGTSRALIMFEWPAGSVWAGSADGLARITGDRPVLLTTAQGLPENWVGAVERDAYGHLWLAQLGGLTRLDLADLEAVADGRLPSLTTTSSYDALDGMPGGDPSAWAHPWSFHDRAGPLWFAMGHGVVIVDAQNVERDIRPPVMHIEQVTVDGKAVPQSPVAMLGPAVRRVELRYTGVDLTSGPSVRFRYRLDGFDTSWTNAGTQRVASYTRLAAGRYRFRVEGRGADGVWSPAEAALEMRVAPPLYFRLWFIAAAALMLVLALLTAHLAVLRARSDAIRDERSRLAREIHDSLLQGFFGISLQLEVASDRLSLPASQQPLLDRVRHLVDRTLTEAREVVWDVRLPGLAAADLAAECEDAARRILTDAPTISRVVSRGRKRRLTSSTQAESLGIVEEALANIRTHAAATSVVMELDYGWRRLRITITDDGHGFDVDRARARAGHWGLLGMRERASRVGGRLSIRSALDSGTVVSIDLPYGSRRLVQLGHVHPRD